MKPKSRTARKVFNLEGVQSSEASDIRALLRKRKISFYEVPEGQWLGGGGLWVRREKDFVEARRHIREYQGALQERQRKLRAREMPSPWYEAAVAKFREQPVRIVVVLFVLVFLIVGAWVSLLKY